MAGVGTDLFPLTEHPRYSVKLIPFIVAYLDYATRILAGNAVDVALPASYRILRAARRFTNEPTSDESEP